jgi:hypothetical protein
VAFPNNALQELRAPPESLIAISYLLLQCASLATPVVSYLHFHTTQHSNSKTQYRARRPFLYAAAKPRLVVPVLPLAAICLFSELKLLDLLDSSYSAVSKSW